MARVLPTQPLFNPNCANLQPAINIWGGSADGSRLRDSLDWQHSFSSASARTLFLLCCCPSYTRTRRVQLGWLVGSRGEIILPLLSGRAPLAQPQPASKRARGRRRQTSSNFWPDPTRARRDIFQVVSNWANKRHCE